MLWIQLRDSIVDGDKHGYGEYDGCCPEEGGQQDESAGAARYGAMLEGGTEDKDKRYAIPDWHRFAEHACQGGGCLRVGAVAQLPQLRVDEGCYGELVTCQESRDGCGGDIVSKSHSGIGCSAIVWRIVKWEFQKEFSRMAHMVFDTRFKAEMEGLDEPPFDSDFGQKIYKNVSKKSWGEWVERQKMLLNEYRLQPWTREAQEFLVEQMNEFFFGEGGSLPKEYVAPSH
jgi:Fe-S cluster biosynthesis and repair protein YggX